jgi:Mg-chelatase subunit ChlD
MVKQGDERDLNKDLLISVILDRSGSMESIKDDTIGAFNGLLADLGKQEGKTLLTLTQFDSQSVDVIVDAIPVQQVPALNEQNFKPRGMTPLLDAIGTTLTSLQKAVSNMAWEGSVLAVVITDGQENASRSWTKQSTFALVKALEAAGWAFIYLGADPDAYSDARALGFSEGSTSRWEKKNAGRVGEAVAAHAERWRTKAAPASQLIRDEERAYLEQR